MREEAFEEVDFESRPGEFLLTRPGFREKVDLVAIFFIITSCTFIIMITVRFRMVPLWTEFLKSNHFLRIVTYPLIVSLIIIIAGIIFRTILWFRYKPLRLDSEEGVDWPTVSVIMPALNEEELVGKAIDSVFASNYPSEKIELIAINDGSTDLTLKHMLMARWKYGDRLRVINFKRNLGKRKALYSGLKISRGSIIVMIDADGKIGRSAIRNLVIPLIKDPQVAAVGGRIAVLNEHENILTRMLSIRYSVSFDFGRAYQSVYGTVFVCPGALTACRKDVLKPLIKEWVNQKFMGTPCLHGEDRALTTMLLKSGFATKYQSNAIVYTKVPSRVRQVNRMYIRWTRSYIRESVLFARFMFSKYRTRQRLLPILDFFFLGFLHPFHIFCVGLISYSLFVRPVFILGHLAVLIVASFLLSLYYLRTNKSWAFVYGIPYALAAAFFLWWIVPFSALTLKNQSWMTR